MEMCYDGALVMPSNYAVMSEDEMMYVEGGMRKYSIDMENKTLAKIINVGIIIGTCALGSSASVGQLAAKIGWEKLKKNATAALLKVGLTTAMAKAGVAAIKEVIGWTIGAGIAEIIDRKDHSGKNGRIQYWL